MEKQDILNQIEWHLEETEGENASGTFDQGYKEGCYHCEALIEQLDEPQKVKVPAAIGKHIKKRKADGDNFHESILATNSQIYEWYMENAELYEQAWVNGYEVEQEQKWKIINDQKYCLTSIEAGYGNSLHWAFDSTKKKPILFDNEETALYTAYITGGTVEKV